MTLALASYFAAVLLEWWHWLRLGFPVTSLPLRPSNAGGLALIPTYLADVVGVGTPVVVATLWLRGARIPAVLFALVAFGAIVLTGTRSVLLIIAGLALAAVLIAIRDRAGRRAVSVVITAVLAVGAVGLVVALASSRSFDEGRSSAYASAIARFTESPILGSGPGTYGVERMHDPVAIIGWLAFPDAHNILLNNLAESGIVGLLGLSATVVLMALAVRGSWRRSPGERIVVAGALFGLAIFAGHGMVDVVFALIGMTVARHRRRRDRGDEQRAGAGVRAIPVGTVACHARSRVRGGRPHLGRRRADRDRRPDRRRRRRGAALASCRRLGARPSSDGIGPRSRPGVVGPGGSRCRDQRPGCARWRPPARRLDRRGSARSG